MTQHKRIPPFVAFILFLNLVSLSSGLFGQVDSNNNQMSDIWELKYGVFGTLAPLDDDDNDTSSNLAESIHGTNPLDATSRLDFNFTVGIGTYNFNWLGVTDKRYWVESQNTPNAALWYSLGGAQTANADGIMNFVTDGSTMLSVPGRMRREIVRRPDIDVLTELRALAADEIRYTDAEDLSTPRNESSRYGQRVRGFLVPPTTGDYTFYFTSDDRGEFYLSSDTTDSNLAKIAEVPEWASWEEWDKFGSQMSVPITLQAGTPYLVEILHQEWWGGDHARVAWSGPGISFQAIPAQFFAGTAPSEFLPFGGDQRFFRLNASDGDLDGDGVTDWEERETGLDPLNATTFGLDDLDYLTRNVGAGSTVTVRRTQGVLYESAADSTKFIIERRGGYEAVTINYAVSGTAAAADHTPLVSGSINFAQGVHSAEFDVTILADAEIEDTETLTMTIGPGSYEIGANNSATVELEDSPPTLYLARLTAQNGAQTAATGIATVWLKGNELYADVSLYFSNLTSTQTAAHIHDGDGDAIVFSLPNGNFENLRWPLREAIPGNPSMEPDILDQITKLQTGGLYINVHTVNFAPGEILGYLNEAQASETFVPPPAPPALPNIPVTNEAASRFLNQASFGPTWDDIADVVAQGYDTWITNQMALPATLHRPRLEAKSNEGISERQEVWWYHSTHAPDQLRQRVAFALSEIFVISDEDGNLRNEQVAMAHYYDMLLGHAFGDFRQLLEDVTLSPMMGIYLSSLRNEKEDLARGISPDENFAREIQQLFTIGLWQLHPDGTAKLGQTGLTVPTYDQEDIVGFSRVFTGWSYKKEVDDPNFYWGDRDYLNPMELYDEYHEDGEKHVINDVVIPANQGGIQDLADALDLLFNHPNVGPFIAKRLIQRLVTSNPSPGYIYRVAQVFDDNGSGVRGDLGAVVRAVLLDYEARSTDHIDFIGHGHLKEPLVRIVGLMRAFEASQPNGELSIRWFIDDFGQGPMSSPTVFNFFTPDYSQPGPLAAAGLASPEFQITSETTSILTANFLYSLIHRSPSNGDNDRLVLDLTSLSESQSGQPPLTDDPGLLADHLSTLLMHGDMTAAKRAEIVTAVNAFDNDDSSDRLWRARCALHLVVTSPEYAVQK